MSKRAIIFTSRKIVRALKILSVFERTLFVRYTSEADHSAHCSDYLSRQLIVSA